LNPLRSRIFEFAYFHEYDRKLEDLVLIAQDEVWDHSEYTARKFPILRNYLEKTFEKLEEEKKIVFSKSGDHACFNSGLLTKNREDIFLLFQKNINQQSTSPYFFINFVKESDVVLNRYFSGNFPVPADYFSKPELLICNPHLPLTIDYDHIIEENNDRFPEQLRDNKYALRNLIKGAVEYTMKVVRNNYRTAVPQYYNGNLQLLLPLYLTDPDKSPDLAMVLYREENGYVARTCLTLKMAYQNARIIVKPESDSWLQP